MKQIIKKYDEKIYTSSALDFYFGGMKIGVLDIETTGLNPSRNKFILGGLFDLQEKEMHQVFAETRGEEEAALTAFLETLSGLDMVITYNGRHFDIPFIERRMKNFGIKGQLPYNLDLYLVLNGHSPIKKFVPNLKQKTVENYMGLWQSRTDEISGGESVELYNMFERTRDPVLGEKILLHNSDDVLQLTRLMKVIGKCDLHRAMYHLGFPAGKSADGGDDHGIVQVKKIRMEKDHLMVSGMQGIGGIDYMGFSFGDWPAETRFDRKTGEFFMKLPVMRDSGLCVVDLDAAGLDRGPFEKYPSCSSGFLVLEDHNDRNFMETNHFVKEFISLFMENI